MTNMLPDDAAFSAATDHLADVVTGPWPPERAALSSALANWSRLLIERAGTQSLSSARILADDAAKRAVVPLTERVAALEKKVGGDDAAG